MNNVKVKILSNQSSETRIKKQTNKPKRKTNKKPTQKNKRIRSLFILQIFFQNLSQHCATFVQLSYVSGLSAAENDSMQHCQTFSFQFSLLHRREEVTTKEKRSGFVFAAFILISFYRKQ